MAVRVALFHAAPQEKGRPAKAEPAARVKSQVVAADPKPRQGAVARAKARLMPKAAEPDTKAAPVRTPDPEPPAAPPAPTGRTRSRFRRAAAPASETAPETRPDTARDAVPEPERPPLPVLQRRSLGATLARATVLAVAIVLMVAFAVALAKVTLVPSPASVHLIHTNLRPGASIRAYLDQPALRDSVKQIGGNIVLGVPFGILLPMLFPRARGLLRVVVITAFVMVLVEATQGAIVEGRAFDIDDVILNTFGALLGYLFLGRRLGRALYPRRTHWYQRASRRPER